MVFLKLILSFFFFPSGFSVENIPDGSLVASIRCSGMETTLEQCLTSQQDATSYNCYYLPVAQCKGECACVYVCVCVCECVCVCVCVCVGKV